VRVPTVGNGNRLAIKDFHQALPETLSALRRELAPGRVDLFNWIRTTTAAFSSLFHASAAIVIHGERYEYFVNEADFSQGKFVRKEYLGTKDLGWDKFDQLFPPDLEALRANELTGQLSIPAKAVAIQNINSSFILVFDKEGKIVDRQVDQQKVEELLIDREYQTKGSVMLVPIIAGGKEEGQRAMAYLYSPETCHFELPQAGTAAFLLSGAAAPALKWLLNS
jgi:hypothetical protein